VLGHGGVVVVVRWCCLIQAPWVPRAGGLSTARGWKEGLPGNDPAGWLGRPGGMGAATRGTKALG